MPSKENKLLSLMVILVLAAGLALAGCGAAKDTWRKVAGTRPPDPDLEAEAKVPPESIEEEVVIDGKVWVRSKNPYYKYMHGEPEYIYSEKGKEFKGLTGWLAASLAKGAGLDEKSRGVPEDKVKEMVRQEVDRILREQGLRAYYDQEKGQSSGVVGRYAAVYPNPETAGGMQGANRMLAAALVDALSRQKDLKVAGPDKVRGALTQAKVTGGLGQRQNLRALGDALGVHGLILTGVVPPTGGNPGFLVVEVYDTYMGNKVDGIAYPVEGTPGSADIEKFARNNAVKVSAALIDLEWFGRVEFTRDENVYLNFGQNAGLKVGDRLKVVTPGQEVINPVTQASLGFTADEPKGDLKVTELLGETGAVAQVVHGGPFKTNDKVKAVQ
jgi:hypothetical protein